MMRLRQGRTGPSPEERAIMNERIEEKREVIESKIKQDLNLIQQRRIHQSVQTFPSDAFQKLDSNGIWDKVLQKMTEKSDITSAYFACQKFHEHFGNNLVTTPFSKVFNILMDKNYFTFAEKAKAEERSKVLNLRLVCKTWKNAIDSKILDEEKFFHDCINCNWLHIIKDPKICVLKNAKPEAVDTAIEMLEGDSSLVKFLCIIQTDQYYQNNETFLSKVKKFLEKCGATVSNFIYRYEDAATFDTWYTLLMHLIPLMPNLTTFRIEPCPTSREWNREQLRLKLQEFPFPSIPSLKYFVVSQYSKDERLTPAILEIMGKCENLKNIRHNYLDETKNEEIAQVLSTMDLERYRVFNISFPQASFIINRVSWPKLKLLTLDLGGKEWTLAKYTDLFAILHRFEYTLEDLTLYGMENVKDDGGVIHLPRLKRLSIMKQNILANLDRFIFTKNLETLELECAYSTDLAYLLGHTDIIQIRGFVKKMETSNVWNIFPNLKEFTIHTYEERFLYFKHGKRIDKRVEKVEFQF